LKGVAVGRPATQQFGREGKRESIEGRFDGFFPSNSSISAPS
jgi:hypothetical protein